jgi:hypothetical protein
LPSWFWNQSFVVHVQVAKKSRFGFGFVCFVFRRVAFRLRTIAKKVELIFEGVGLMGGQDGQERRLRKSTGPNTQCCKSIIATGYTAPLGRRTAGVHHLVPPSTNQETKSTPVVASSLGKTDCDTSSHMTVYL